MNSAHILFIGLLAMVFGLCTLSVVVELIPDGKAGRLKWYHICSIIYGLCGIIGGLIASLIAMGLIQ